MARIPSYIQPYMLDHVGKARGKTRDWSGGERADHWESSGHGDDRTAIVQGSAEKRELSWRSKSERERSAKEQNREVA